MQDNIDFAVHMETVALALRGPPSSKHGNEWRYGTNGSLSIDIKCGTFFDHEHGIGGGTLAFIRHEKPGVDAVDYLRGLGCVEKPRPGNGANDDPFKGVTFKKSSKQFRVVRTWQYTDENGTELFEVCRLENGESGADGKPRKEYKQRRKENGEYINNVKGIRQVPYRLPDLTEAVAQNKTIFVVEGEKCADAVIALGGAATCNAMGGGKWPDELVPFFKGADVVILPDNAKTGADHANLVATKLQGTAKRVRILELPGLPPKGDVADWIEAGGTLAWLCELAETNSTTAVEDPLPLFPPLQDAELYPVDALGRTLSRATSAISSRVQVPHAMAAQSVLAAASLATCSQADVMMPFGQPRPLTLFLSTVASSGDRKSTADNEALWPVRKYEKNLRDEYETEIEEWKIEHSAWSAQKRKIEGDGKIEIAERRARLAALGKEPEKPLAPFLVAGDPTIEGLTKNWTTAHAALGLFTAEGGSFTGGHGMNEDNRLKTGAMLSELWDGLPIKRIRATDGITILPGRRLAMHVMLQLDAASAFLSNRELQDQGLLSRILTARPKSMSGTRPYKETTIDDDDAAIKAYGARLLSILEATPALAEGKRNELAPRALPISPDATKLWIAFHDHVEAQLAPDGPLAPIKGFAAKAAEHAARIAGVITIVEDLYAPEISAEVMAGAITLADWYVNEALRLQQAGMTDPRLRHAAALLEWIQAQPDMEIVFREILRLGPNQTRTKNEADQALAILNSHNWTTEVSARPRVIKARAPI